jgi:hypothetical protein
MMLSKSNPQIIERFTAELSDEIGAILPILKDAFQDFRQGSAGAQLGELCRGLFDEWLTSSVLPTVNEAAYHFKRLLLKALRTGDLTQIQREAREKLGMLDGDILPQLVVDMIASARQGQAAEQAVGDRVWRAFDRQIFNFLVENAHHLVGRLLMYCVGLDKNCWNPLTVQQTVQTPYLNHYWEVRERQSPILPSLYHLNEFDWFYVNHVLRQSLSPSELSMLNRHESRLDKELSRLHQVLSSYDYSQVDFDVWEEVYQGFLTEEQIGRLGFVTTPREIVELILDLVGYFHDKRDLCKTRILDPACGSGTFLVEAVSRLLKHLDTNMPCHANGTHEPAWEKEKRVLEAVLADVHGIDINPFAAFLTTVNLSFQLISKYSVVSRHYPSFGINLDIQRHDALSSKPAVVAPTTPYVNARLKEKLDHTERVSALFDSKFHYVVGNPPWGAVLKGVVGPLGNEEKRIDYKKRFESAHSPSGKYDIFVLFLERGIKWLEENGILGMITQVNWVSQDFGEGIKKVMKREGTPTVFVDLQQVGAAIFPKWTNYPAITVLERNRTGGKVRVVEVSEK